MRRCLQLSILLLSTSGCLVHDVVRTTEEVVLQVNTNRDGSAAAGQDIEVLVEGSVGRDARSQTDSTGLTRVRFSQARASGALLRPRQADIEQDRLTGREMLVLIGRNGQLEALRGKIAVGSRIAGPTLCARVVSLRTGSASPKNNER